MTELAYQDMQNRKEESQPHAALRVAEDILATMQGSNQPLLEDMVSYTRWELEQALDAHMNALRLTEAGRGSLSYIIGCALTTAAEDKEARLR